VINKVLPLNQELDVSPHTAESLWRSCHMYVNDQSQHALISADNQWVIRKRAYPDAYYPDGLNIKAPQLCETAKKAFNELRVLGINVITHAFTPSLDNNHIYTVSPYVPGLRKCPNSDYRSHIAPLLGEYFKSILLRTEECQDRVEPFLEDVDRATQFSKLSADGVPFLHDVDPYMRNSREYAETKYNLIAEQALRYSGIVIA
jgi:hypothetical protein